MSESKPSNPKDAFGSAKAPLGLVPDTATVEVSMAFLEGALKYGRYNWRVAGVRASIYNDAMERHRMKWWNGQERDAVTRVKHLGNLIACATIILDAELCGMLEDDRPPALVPLADYMDQMQPLVAHLKNLFKDHTPIQYTQKSHPRGQTSIPPGLSYAEVFGVDEPVKTPPPVVTITGDITVDGTLTPGNVPTGTSRSPCPVMGCRLTRAHVGDCDVPAGAAAHW